jgi:hypothetical protein
MSSKRVDIEYNVSGTTHDDLMSAAVKLWRQYTGDESAELPYDAEISVHPMIEDTTGVVLTWVASVKARYREE